MTEPTLYRKETLANVRSRNSAALTTEEKTRVKTVVDKFFELFAAKHL